MIRKMPCEHLLGYQLVLPPEIYDKRRDLFVDIFKIAGFRFLLCEPKRVQYIKIYNLISSKLDKIAPLIRRKMNKYTNKD